MLRLSCPESKQLAAASLLIPLAHYTYEPPASRSVPSLILGQRCVPLWVIPPSTRRWVCREMLSLLTRRPTFSVIERRQVQPLTGLEKRAAFLSHPRVQLSVTKSPSKLFVASHREAGIRNVPACQSATGKFRPSVARDQRGREEPGCRRRLRQGNSTHGRWQRLRW